MLKSILLGKYGFLHEKGSKSRKDRITLMATDNAGNDFRLPLLFGHESASINVQICFWFGYFASLAYGSLANSIALCVTVIAWANAIEVIGLNWNKYLIS